MMISPSPVVSHERLRVLTETISRLSRRGAGKALSNILAKTHANDLAQVLRGVNREEITPIFLAAPRALSALALTDVSPRVLEIVIEEVDEQVLAATLETLPPDDLTDLISRLEPDLAQKLLAHMRTDSKQEVEDLLQYDPDTAGGIMTPDFFALSMNLSVAEAIETLHGLSDVEMVFYLYVVDAELHLKGVISMRQLLLAKPESKLRDIMNPRVMKVHTSTRQEDVAQLAQNYRILAVPVVDAGRSARRHGHGRRHHRRHSGRDNPRHAAHGGHR